MQHKKETIKRNITQLLNETSNKYQHVSAFHWSFSGRNPVMNICWVVT